MIGAASFDRQSAYLLWRREAKFPAMIELEKMATFLFFFSHCHQFLGNCPQNIGETEIYAIFTFLSIAALKDRCFKNMKCIVYNLTHKIVDVVLSQNVKVYIP